jgi:hypothetical protein
VPVLSSFSPGASPINIALAVLGFPSENTILFLVSPNSHLLNKK